MASCDDAVVSSSFYCWVCLVMYVTIQNPNKITNYFLNQFLWDIQSYRNTNCEKEIEVESESNRDDHVFFIDK